MYIYKAESEVREGKLQERNGLTYSVRLGLIYGIGNESF
jgi:hypothetical protein